MSLRLAAAAVLLLLAGAARAEGPKAAAIDYPAGYRQWPLVKSMVIFSDKNPLFEQFGGFHNIYVNSEGWRALTKGGTFPDGAVLVFDLLQAKEEDGAYAEGERKLVAVMVKNRTQFKNTGGWGFEAFKGDSRTERMVTDPMKQCFSCHQKQKDNDFLFSGYRP
jgi:Cytochrome P460